MPIVQAAYSLGRCTFFNLRLRPLKWRKDVLIEFILGALWRLLFSFTLRWKRNFAEYY